MTTKKTKLTITQIKAIVENYKQAWDIKLNEMFDASDERAKKAAEVEIATLVHKATMYETDPAFKAFLAHAVRRHFNNSSDAEMYHQGLISKTYMDAMKVKITRGKARELREKMCNDLKLALMLDPSADYTQVAATIETLNFNWKEMEDGTSQT
jgi:hypothetical protein